MSEGSLLFALLWFLPGIYGMTWQEAPAGSMTRCWVISNTRLCHSSPDSAQRSGWKPERCPEQCGTEVTSTLHINPATVFTFDEGRQRKILNPIDLKTIIIHRFPVLSGNHGAQSGVALDSWGEEQADGRSAGATTRCLAAQRSLKGVCVSLD